MWCASVDDHQVKPRSRREVEFQQQISRVSVPLVSEAPEFVEISPFVGEFDELIGRSAIPRFSEVA